MESLSLLNFDHNSLIRVDLNKGKTSFYNEKLDYFVLKFDLLIFRYFVIIVFSCCWKFFKCFLKGIEVVLHHLDCTMVKVP